ncbi:MAG: hypothetical protein RQ722_11050, partial [Desulfuromonadales bacterium]|nr:hypothetical protein [Desulfuromonadales bacterium]
RFNAEKQSKKDYEGKMNDTLVILLSVSALNYWTGLCLGYRSILLAIKTHIWECLVNKRPCVATDLPA